MDKNDEGILWVKLLQTKSSPSHPPTRSATLIPIRWLKESNRCTSKDRNVGAVHSLSPHDHEHDNVLSDGDLKKGAAKDQSSSKKSNNDPNNVEKLSPVVDGEHTFRRLKDDDDCGDELCVVCMERAADFQLLPCHHDKFCRQCIVETICTWVRPEAPCCPLCRGAFHTMVLLDGDDN